MNMANRTERVPSNSVKKVVGDVMCVNFQSSLKGCAKPRFFGMKSSVLPEVRNNSLHTRDVAMQSRSLSHLRMLVWEKYNFWEPARIRPTSIKSREI